MSEGGAKFFLYSLSLISVTRAGAARGCHAAPTELTLFFNKSVARLGS